MNFETLTMQAVKSIAQRNLLYYWNELSAERSFPPLSRFQLDTRMHDQKALAIWAVEQGATGRRFRARQQGSWLTQVFQENWVGKIMSDVMPEALRQYALDTANRCATSGCAVFSIISTIDPAGHRVDCERLLLPFGSGSEVEEILASFHLISLKGTFERRTIIDRFRIASKVELVGGIRSGFKRPPITTPGVVVELRTPARDGHSEGRGSSSLV